MGERNPAQEFDYVRSRWIDVEENELRAKLGEACLGIGQRLDGADCMAGREFLQRRSDGSRKRIIFFDEKNARRCPGRRFVGSRHGKSVGTGRQ